MPCLGATTKSSLSFGRRPRGGLNERPLRFAPPLVTHSPRPRAQVQPGCELSRRPSPKREETVDGKVVHLSLEQVKEDNVGREDDQERAYRRLHNIGQNEVSRLKGLINGVRGVGA